MGNPFTLIFGKSPPESIDRPVQKNEILDAFLPLFDEFVKGQYRGV